MINRKPPSDASAFFSERKGCPFCGASSDRILCQVRYHETAEANLALPDIQGTLYRCLPCGVAYPSHMYRVEAFPEFYNKTLVDWAFLDESFLQRIRIRYLTEMLRNFHKPFSFSRFLDHISLHVLQVPRLRREAQGLRILDVGCGFGEFPSIFKALGNEVTGTEIVPALVERLVKRGNDCLLGELEDIDFGSRKFDVILLRAVFYRTRNPVRTIERLKHLLAPGGEVVLVDPCPGVDGVEYFFRKQFPQGQFYIVEKMRYFDMLRKKFALVCMDEKLIYGRHSAPLKPVRMMGNIVGLFELLAANLFRYKPYVLSYNVMRLDKCPE